MSQDTDVAAKEVLAGLRAALDPDADRAARKYALLRRKLVSFFEWGGANAPDACADETLTKTAWTLTDGPLQNIAACCVATARTLLQRQTQPEPAPAPALPADGEMAAETAPASPATPPPAPPPDPFANLEWLLHAFENGFDELTPENQDLVLTYYTQPHAIEAKQALAARLNLPVNQLRLRAHRTRSQLEQSVLGLARSASGGAR